MMVGAYKVDIGQGRHIHSAGNVFNRHLMTDSCVVADRIVPSLLLTGWLKVSGNMIPRVLVDSLPYITGDADMQG